MRLDRLQIKGYMALLRDGLSFPSIGREYGVSGESIRKTLRRKGLPSTHREYLEWLRANHPSLELPLPGPHLDGESLTPLGGLAGPQAILHLVASLNPPTKL